MHPSLDAASSPLPVRGCVLAGGAGRRLGGRKAIAELAGRPLLAHPVEAFRRAGLDPVIIAKADTPLPDLAAEVWAEPARPIHPAAGIAFALRRAGHPLVVCAADMPFVPPALAAWLAAQREPFVVPEIGGSLEPLLARYSPQGAGTLLEAASEGRSLTDAVTRLAPRRVTEAELERFGDPRRIVANVNDGDDLARAEAEMGSG
jgi:molybdopterin-guanine dinucleotide biosynthesis protein A